MINGALNPSNLRQYRLEFSRLQASFQSLFFLLDSIEKMSYFYAYENIEKELLLIYHHIVPVSFLFLQYFLVYII